MISDDHFLKFAERKLNQAKLSKVSGRYLVSALFRYLVNHQKIYRTFFSPHFD